MVVPFSEPAEKACRKKEKFNKKLRRGRVQVIECGFGVWARACNQLRRQCFDAASCESAPAVVCTTGW